MPRRTLHFVRLRRERTAPGFWPTTGRRPEMISRIPPQTVLRKALGKGPPVPIQHVIEARPDRNLPPKHSAVERFAADRRAERQLPNNIRGEGIDLSQRCLWSICKKRFHEWKSLRRR
jgi:hypothetical protein